MSVGYVDISKLVSPGRKITVRTLEGDIDVIIEEDMHIIIGVEGEIYPCTGERFKRSYRELPDTYEFPGEYPPAVIDIEKGDRIELLSYAKSCLSVAKSGVFAKELNHRVKIFTKWDRYKYYLGVPGDFLAVRVDDESDIYVINREVFFKSYEPYNENQE